MSKKQYVIWDTIENEIVRGPWSSAECKRWISWSGEVLKSPENVEKMFAVKKFHRNNGYKKFIGGYLLGLGVGMGVVIYGVATDKIRIHIIDYRKKDEEND